LCHRKGHIKAEYWTRGGGKEGQWPRKDGVGRGSTTTAAAKSDIEGLVRAEYFDVGAAEVAEYNGGVEAGAVEKGVVVGGGVNGDADVPVLWGSFQWKGWIFFF
jgi:hypothetical protein